MENDRRQILTQMEESNFSNLKKIDDLLPGDIRGVSYDNLKKLLDINERLKDNGLAGGVLEYFVSGNKGLRRLEQELELTRFAIANVFDYYGLPRPTKSESSKISFILSPRRSLTDLEKSLRSEQSKTMWQKEGHRETVSAALKKYNDSSKVRKRKSEQTTERWKSQEHREKVIPKLRAATKARWEDPNGREKMTLAIRESASKRIYTADQKSAISDKMKDLWQDPIYREKMLEAGKRIKHDPERLAILKELQRQHMLRLRMDTEIEIKRKTNSALAQARPETQFKKSIAMKKMWNDLTPEERIKHSHFTRLWKNPQFREQRLADLKVLLADEEYQQKRRVGMQVKWADPEYREKMTELSRRQITNLNRTTNQLEKAAEGIRKLRSDPESAKRFKLSTIQGYRRDIGYFAESAWEANVARVLMLRQEDFYPKESVILEVAPEYKHLFKFDITQFTIDFVAVDQQDDNLIAYELMAHPLEDPVGLAKAAMFKVQFPHINLRLIKFDEYSQMRKLYSKQINSLPQFCGWETSKDNLRLNPDKYR